MLNYQYIFPFFTIIFLIILLIYIAYIKFGINILPKIINIFAALGLINLPFFTIS